jgi:hypothetical protein
MADIYIIMKAKVIIKQKARGEDNTAQANDSDSIQNVPYDGQYSNSIPDGHTRREGQSLLTFWKNASVTSHRTGPCTVGAMTISNVVATKRTEQLLSPPSEERSEHVSCCLRTFSLYFHEADKMT